jgi:glycosyltransferase involved in cell wall biosynthesis
MISIELRSGIDEVRKKSVGLGIQKTDSIQMKLIILNHYAGGPALGMEHRPWFLANSWIKMGHEARIIAASFAHTRTQQPSVSGVFQESEVEGVPYTFLRTTGYRGNTLRRILNMILFVKSAWILAGFMARRYRPDVVIASSTYPLDIWPARRMARIAGAKLVYEVHDLWPLSPIELGGYSPRHPYIRLLQYAENYAYRHADKVASLLPHTIEHMVSHGMDRSKFLYIPNGIPADEWDINAPLPEAHSELLDKLQRDHRIVVGYTGAHGIANALDPFIEAASLLKDAPISFVLVGSGPEKERLMQKVAAADLAHVHFCTNVAKRSLPALLHRMDILYVGFRKQSLYRFGVSPNKLFDYMMAGKPVIQGIEAGNNPVKEAGCGMAIEPDNPEAIAQAVRELIQMTPEKRAQMGAAGKAYVVSNHDYAVLAEQFIAGITQ